MCPACLTTVTLAAVSATSTGGLAALIARHVRRRKRMSPPSQEKSPAKPEPLRKGDPR